MYRAAVTALEDRTAAHPVGPNTGLWPIMNRGKLGLWAAAMIRTDLWLNAPTFSTLSGESEPVSAVSSSSLKLPYF